MSARSLSANAPLELSETSGMFVVENGHVDLFAAREGGRRRHLTRISKGDAFFGVPSRHGMKLLAVGCEAVARPEDPEDWAVAAYCSTLAADIPPAFSVIGLEKFHAQLLQRLSESFQREEADERERAARRLEHDSKVYTNALAGLASLVDSAESGAAGASISTHQGLDAALEAVGRHAGVVFEPVPKAAKSLPLKHQIDAVCRASRLRSRSVALRDDWWTSDCGPLLAAKMTEKGDEAGAPVAVLPAGFGRYELFDPEDGSRRPLGKDAAEELFPLATTFYKPFPDRPLKFKDVFNFVGKELLPDTLTLLAMAVSGAALALAPAWAVGQLFDSTIPNADKGGLAGLIAALIAASVASACFNITQSFAMLRINTKWDTAVQAALWDRLMRLPAPFYRGYSVGDLAYRANAINQIRAIVSGAALSTAIGSLQGLFNFFLLLKYSGTLAFTAAVVLLGSMVFYTLCMWATLQLRDKINTTQRGLQGLVFQMLGGVTKLRVTHSERRAFSQWSKLYAEAASLQYRSNTWDTALGVFNSALPVISSAALFWAVHVSMKASPISMGQFAAFNAAFIVVLTSGIQLSSTLFQIIGAIPIWESAKPILETIPEGSSKPAAGALKGRIEVSHVTFRYKGDGPVILDDVSFGVEPGEFVALVGPSGSGKSTMLRLLLGFETPELGTIFYDDQDISKFDASSIRRQIGTVLQNGRMLAGDIKTNIIGNLPLTIDDAWAAAEMAGVADDIRAMPMGMFTVISEGASTLSGGQKQRIIIARALVRKPQTIFFDEATSALDNRTQAVVTESLDKMRVTRVVIAHRLSTIRNADRIIVMNKGRVIQEGAFDQLMAEEGLFKEMASRQMA